MYIFVYDNMLLILV